MTKILVMEAVVTKATERRVKLTKRTVDAAKPEEVRYILWDESLAGFGLRVEPTRPEDVYRPL